MTEKAYKFINAVSLLAVVTVNALANILRLGGNTTGSVSAQYTTLITPTPVTFAIWGVIYALMAVFVLYGFGVFGEKDKRDQILENIGFTFLIGCVFNILWIFLWHFEKLGLSVIAIAGLLISLIFTESRLERAKQTKASFLAVKVGFDIYFGWIIAAAITNIAAFLKSVGWNGFSLSDTFWAVAVLLAGTVIASLVMTEKMRWISVFAVIWAYIGMIIKHLSAKGFDGKYPVVTGTLIICIIAMVSVVLIKLWQKKAIVVIKK